MAGREDVIGFSMPSSIFRRWQPDHSRNRTSDYPNPTEPMTIFSLHSNQWRRHLRSCVGAACLSLGFANLVRAQDGVDHHPVARIGQPEVELSQVSRIAVSYRGAVAVVQPQDFNVRVFDSAGTPIATIGRRGEAPGEFSRMFGASVGWVGDTVWVFERSVGRLSYFRHDGELLRVESESSLLRPPATQAGGNDFEGVASIEALGIGGTRIISIGINSDRPIPSWLSDVRASDQAAGALALVAVDPHRRYRRTMAIVPEPAECTQRSGQMFAVVPLCPRTIHALSPDGQRVATAAARGRDSYRIEVADASSDVAPTTITQRVTPVRADQSAKDSIRKSLTGGQTVPAEVERWIAELPIPDWYPPLERILLGADGTIWAKEYQDRGLPQRWRVFNAWGREIRSVALPGGADVRWARLDSIWAVQEDADGAEELVRYAVQ